MFKLIMKGIKGFVRVGTPLIFRRVV